MKRIIFLSIFVSNSLFSLDYFKETYTANSIFEAEQKIKEKMYSNVFQELDTTFLVSENVNKEEDVYDLKQTDSLRKNYKFLSNIRYLKETLPNGSVKLTGIFDEESLKSSIRDIQKLSWENNDKELDDTEIKKQVRLLKALNILSNYVDDLKIKSKILDYTDSLFKKLEEKYKLGVVKFISNNLDTDNMYILINNQFYSLNKNIYLKEGSHLYHIYNKNNTIEGVIDLKATDRILKEITFIDFKDYKFKMELNNINIKYRDNIIEVLTDKNITLDGFESRNSISLTFNNIYDKQGYNTELVVVGNFDSKKIIEKRYFKENKEKNEDFLVTSMEDFMKNFYFNLKSNKAF